MNWADRLLWETEGAAIGGYAAMNVVIATHALPLLRVIWRQRCFSLLRRRVGERLTSARRKIFE
jgi:hypothetical protein